MDSLYLACHEKRTFFISVQSKIYILWPCQKVLQCSLISFGQYIYKIWFEIIYRKIVDSPMGTNCAPLVADLFCLALRGASCCLFLSDNNQADVDGAFNSAPRQ